MSAQYDELNDEYNRYLNTQQAAARAGANVNTGNGIVSLQGLSAANLQFDSAAAPAPRLVFSTNGLDTITVLVAGLGPLAGAAQLAHQNDVPVLGGAAPAAYDQAHYASVMAKLDALIVAHNNLLAELQAKGLMAP